MEENRDSRLEKIKALEKEINALPTDLQNAICWAIENYSALEKMGRKSEMTLEEIQKAKKDALAKENYVTLMLLYITEYTKYFTENEGI